jgi:PAS domain S-box-containing protein
MTAIKRLARTLVGRLSTKFRVSIGLVLLLLSLLMGLMYIGLVPDQRQLVREARAHLAETIAANLTALITLTDREHIEAVMQFLVERNNDLLSAGIRRADGTMLVQIGEHAAQWQAISGQHSVDTQLQVPIWHGPAKWGQVELRFEAENWFAGMGIDVHPQILLILVVGVTSMLIFYLYLSRTLRHLDPSKAVPPRVRAALDTMAEGLMVVDLEGYIVLANQSLAGILGRDADDIIGDPATLYAWTDADGSALPYGALPWAVALQERRMLTSQRVRLAAADGVMRSFNVNCSPVLGDGDRHGGVLVSFDDVTVLEQKEVELRESRDAAEAANRAKSAFLANMSHEIRTPMNAILGFTEVLRRGYDRGSQDWKGHLATIHSSGRHLLELINDILDLSKVESGKLEVERIETPPHVIVREVVKVLGVKAREKNIFLSLNADGPVPENISTDPGRLRQIVTNLVGNAIKFTEQGGVSVLLRVEPTARGTMYLIDVTDTGVGMEPETLERIFNPFEQADKSVTRRFGGTGLGLSISRRFAEALGGEITVRSTPGQGSTFTVSLDPGPLDGIRMLSPDELALHDQNVELDAGLVWQFPDTRVLVVDDGKQNRALVRLVLEESNIAVEEAENGQIGVDKALEGGFDVVLMDINMPVMDGFTALARLRGEGIDIPILALTADVMEGFEDKVLTAGFTGYITKPIDFDVLMGTLAKYTGAVQVAADTDASRSDPAEVAPASPDAPAALPAPDRAADGPAIVSRLPVRDPRFRIIVDEFIDQLGERMAAVEQAWAAQDFEALRSAAHYLKGAGGSVGFDEFTEPSAHLEQLAKAQRREGVEDAIAVLRDLALRVVLEAPCGEPAPAQGPTDETVPVPPAQTPIFSTLKTADRRFRVIVEEFLDQLPERIAAVEQAWASRDFEALRAAAHYLKGAGGSVGFDEFTEPSARLELLAKAKQEEGVEDAVCVLCNLASRVAIGEGSAAPQAATH